MPKKTTALLCSLFFAVTFAFPFHTARAVMPPDFISNIGSQLIQVFSVAAIFLSAVFGVSYKYIKVKLATIATKKIYLAVAIILVLAISAGATYFYKDYKQNQEFDNWIALSEQNEQALKPSVGIRRAPADQLEFGTAPAIETETPVNPNFIVQIENAPTDPVAEFIKKYYENIANGNLEDAYEMSKKSTSLNTFKSWYTNTTKVTLDNMVRIDDTKSSLELTLHEGPSYTKYGVLMTVNLENNIPKNIEKSEVRVLAEGKTPTDTTPAATPNKEGILREYYDFFEQNQSNPLSITNSKFKSIIDSGQTDYIVMDARENIEHNNGHFPNSTHIRYADLQAGRWIEIPNDKFVYVLCWSGIRGKEVAEFLRTKNIVASYLEEGAKGWYDYGGLWDGNIDFAQKYSEERYRITFSTSQVRSKIAEGVFIIDSREPWKYEQSHIEGSINIPIMYTPSIDMEATFAQVPANSRVITVCDGYVNCFDAKLTGVELENRGHTFLGRYNKPWEY